MVHCTDTKENYDVVESQNYMHGTAISVITQDPWTESLHNRQFWCWFSNPDNQDFNGVQKSSKTILTIRKKHSHKYTQINPWPVAKQYQHNVKNDSLIN